MCKIFLNILEKGVDFFEQREYNKKLSRERLENITKWSKIKKKLQKSLKNLLTNRKQSDIINKLLREKRQTIKSDLEGLKSDSKINFEKPLDKLEKMWYNNKVVWEIRKTELRKAPWKLNNTERINITLSIPWQKCRGWENE